MILLLLILRKKGEKMQKRIVEITRIGILSALVLAATFINFMLPLGANGGLVHLGTPVAVIATLVFGWKIGAISGAIGMTLFDILSGWVSWAPITCFARLGFGLILGTIAYANDKKGNNIIYNVIGIVLAGVFMIGAYYIYNIVIYRDVAAALASIPGDILQVGMSAIIGIPISLSLKRYMKVEE